MYPYHYISPVVCLFASLASRSACLGLVVYLDLLSGYVGLLQVSPDTVANKLLQLKLDVG